MSAEGAGYQPATENLVLGTVQALRARGYEGECGATDRACAARTAVNSCTPPISRSTGGDRPHPRARHRAGPGRSAERELPVVRRSGHRTPSSWTEPATPTSWRATSAAPGEPGRPAWRQPFRHGDESAPDPCSADSGAGARCRHPGTDESEGQRCCLSGRHGPGARAGRRWGRRPGRFRCRPRRCGGSRRRPARTVARRRAGRRRARAWSPPAPRGR